MSEQMDAEEFAKRVLTELADIDQLRGVGYYTPEECNSIYLREDVQHTTDAPSRALEDAVLESISQQTLEDIFSDDLVGTIRFFETKVVLYSCGANHRGVVVSFDRETVLDYCDILTKVETIAEESNVTC